ncbi:hypothetical protein LO772_31155 [Yinghuangia sp. ASG 101]|uniref:hypothetical protein n=1 Tax=Yinghuangia sp. ASG 101 TaxID=2896848 RepID=UPI001E2B1019|nr:hypothetical protein [Yinghuangia sp. ASG 101]UGQ11210.1 hypothetical protein LO772_31155 [Yinghuangia sp. ASG 101]
MYPATFAEAAPDRPAVIMGRKAVVQPYEDTAAGSELADRLLAHCREHLAGYKCPRSLEFTAEPLRTPAGKVRIEALRERFGAAPGAFARR